MTTYTGAGDDGELHSWRSDGGEELTRVCDGVVATNVTLFARDLHAGWAHCEACRREAHKST